MFCASYKGLPLQAIVLLLPPKQLQCWLDTTSDQRMQTEYLEPIPLYHVIQLFRYMRLTCILTGLFVCRKMLVCRLTQHQRTVLLHMKPGGRTCYGRRPAATNCNLGRRSSLDSWYVTCLQRSARKMTFCSACYYRSLLFGTFADLCSVL